MKDSIKYLLIIICFVLGVNYALHSEGRSLGEHNKVSPGIYVGKSYLAQLIHRYPNYYGVNCIYLAPDSTFSISNCIFEPRTKELHWWDHFGYGKWYISHDSLFFDFSDSYKRKDDVDVPSNLVYSIYNPAPPMAIENGHLSCEGIPYNKVAYNKDSVPRTISHLNDIGYLIRHRYFIKNFSELVDSLGKVGKEAPAHFNQSFTESTSIEDFQIKPGVFIARDDSLRASSKFFKCFGVNCLYLSPDGTFCIINYLIGRNWKDAGADHIGYGRWYTNNDSLYFDFKNRKKPAGEASSDEPTCLLAMKVYSENRPLNTMLLRNDTIIDGDTKFSRVKYIQDSMPAAIYSLRQVFNLRRKDFFIENFSELVDSLRKVAPRPVWNTPITIY